MILLDGAMGTELSRRGFELADPLWSAKVLLEAPEAILELHRDYLEAGSDIVSTASYQISEPGFLARGLTRKDARRALASSYEVARAALRQRADSTGDASRAIAVSLGPYGAILADGSEYSGDYDLSHAELVRFHRERFEVAADIGAGLVALETFPTLNEAEAALEALDDFATLSAWLSFVPRAEAVAVEKLVSPRLAALAFNCGAPELTFEAAARAAKTVTLPVFAYPNRGGTWDASTKTWRAVEVVDWGRWVEWARSAGLRGLGGCCETSPETIASLHAALKATRGQPA